MRILEYIVTTPLAQALGWTLLHSLWEGVVIAAGLGAVLVSTRLPRVRYAAACLAMLAVITCAAFTLVRVMPEGGHERATIALPPTPAQPPSTAADLAPSRPSLAAAVPWLAPFWIVGVWIFSLWQMAGWISASCLRRRGVCAAPDSWQQEIARLRSRLRVSPAVSLLESCVTEVPVVIGHFRPVILMPIGVLAGLPAGQVESILVHELAHIRRCDYLVNLLQRWVECLLFYHPAVWWMSRVIRTERENCCDDVAAAMCSDVREYAVALTALEQNRQPERRLALAATGGSLMKRIRRLLYPAASGGAWSPFFVAVILVGTAAAAFATWPARGAQQAGVSQSQPAQARSSAYDKWLNEDVVYLVSDQERADFLSLGSDQARDEFVRQFWERHNPNPRLPAGAFKGEHYRRIAYSNQHFAGSVPGWQSDRGRIYIEFGSPDAIEVGPNATPRSETWTYRPRDGREARSFTFVERSGNGDYRLVSEGTPALPAVPATSQPAVGGFVRRPVMPDASSGTSVRGMITSGGAKRLQEVRFAGVTQLGADALNECADLLKASANSDPGWMQQLDERARVLCWQHRGYFKAQVTPEFQQLADRDGKQQYAVTLSVNEGAQYRFSGISFRNNQAFPTSELRAMFKVADGDVYDSLAVRDGINAVRQAYGSRGYSNWVAASDVKLDEANRTVELILGIGEDVGQGAIRISEGVAMGNLVHRVDPVYPDMAKAARVQADAVYQVRIGQDGKVNDVRVVSGHPMLVQAGLDAVRQWQFKPLYSNGQPVEVATQVTIPFRLPEPEATTNQQPPDMSCTYYDQKAQLHEGVCEASERDKNLFYCRQADGTKPRQVQIGCEWKVQRLREWERRQSHSK